MKNVLDINLTFLLKFSSEVCPIPSFIEVFGIKKMSNFKLMQHSVHKISNPLVNGRLVFPPGET